MNLKWISFCSKRGFKPQNKLITVQNTKLSFLTLKTSEDAYHKFYFPVECMKVKI
jgi:hypothetical protein